MPVRKQGQMTEIGETGLREFSGWIREEWLTQLKNRTVRFRIYDEMRMNDPVIGAMLFVMEMVARSVSWAVIPASENDQEDIDVADFVESCMHDMSHTWTDLIAEIFTMLWAGFSYHELVYKRRSGTTANPSSRHDDGRIGWRKIPIRAQRYVERWEFDEEGGIEGGYQRKIKGGEVFIPIEKALLFRTTLDKNNPEGRSALRNVYRHWYMKKRIEEIEGIGIERDLAGLPVISANNALLKEKGNEALQDNYEKIVRNIRMDEMAGIVLPFLRDPKTGEREVFLELLSTGGSRQFDTDKIINRYDSRILMTVMADFIMMGHEKVGSFALTDNKTHMFAVAMNAMLDEPTEVFNRHGIPRLLRLNGIDQDRQPKLQHGDIETPDLDKLSKLIRELTGAGMPLFPDDELENTIRGYMGFPEKPEDDGEAIAAPPSEVEQETELS